MQKGRINCLKALLVASALAMPQLALAAPAGSREAALEARLERLESELAALRGEMAATRSSQEATAAAAQAAATQSQATATRVAAIEAKPAPAPVATPDGMRSGSSTIKIGGYIKLLAANTHYGEGEVASNSLGRDFYLPQAVPTGAGPSSRVQDFTAKQSRFWLNFATDVKGHTLKGYVETDFQTSPGTQGSQRTTNGYNLALRRAYMQFDKWTFGEDWSTFQYTGALPESTDYVGGAEGTVFVRQPLVRYSAPLSKEVTLHLGIENPESGTATLGSPTLVENGDDRMPDFTARLAYAGTLGELSFAGLVRQVHSETAGVSASKGGYGVSAGGKLFLNEAKSGDVRFMVTYGKNISRYVGLNFAPDAVYVPATNTFEDVNVFAAIGAVRVPLTPQLRVNVMGSYQSVDYSSALALASIGTYNQRAWSGAINLFYTPVKNIDLGIEYRHGERKLVNAADGATDRIEFAAKYSF
ncbi:DcaP family trimeric outer membrane transporter [Novosphingobium aquae]|uniref:DcaP family trimeric outer membrane transporter n=1 Tax=Novosphingobium aquae TaxID=3133435 RepID=A0ABU8SDA0_9SPHN